MTRRADRRRSRAAALRLAALSLAALGLAALGLPAPGLAAPGAGTGPPPVRTDTPAAPWNEFGLATPPAPARGDSIVEPFFAFVLDKAETDAVGRWSTSDLAAFASVRGTPSRLPVAHLVSLERRRPEPGSEDRYPGARVAAEWILGFDDRLAFPLPYSLLGYHPGSLRLASSLVLAELAPVDLTLAWQAGHGREQRSVDEVRVFACERGYLLLDADAMVDRLLGDLLDDAWTVGFATARDGDRRLAVSVMLGRDERAIYGEFDLARDRIEPHGRPEAAALAAAARRWLAPAAARLPTPWVED